MKNEKNMEIDTLSGSEAESKLQAAESLISILPNDVSLEEARKEYMEKKFGEPNEITYAAIEVAESNKDMYGPFDSTEDLMKALND